MRHVVRGRGGRHRRVNLTPLKAIRLFCLECTGFKAAAVRSCPDALCPLWPFRRGQDPAATRPRPEPSGPAPSAGQEDATPAPAQGRLFQD